MKTHWIRRSLFALASVTVLAGGLAACGHRGHPGQWSEERVTEVRGKVVERISSKLDLNAEQKTKLGVLADELIASRKVVRGGSTDPRADVLGLISGEKFDRSAAQQMLDRKLEAVQGQSPRLITAFGDFYDSLNPEQQKQVRERIEQRRSGWWGRG